MTSSEGANVVKLRWLREYPGTQARSMGNHRVHPVQKLAVGTGATLGRIES